MTTPYWFGTGIGHADIAVACALRFVGEAHPARFDARHPALKAHAARCEALPEFRECSGPGAAEGVTIPPLWEKPTLQPY